MKVPSRRRFLHTLSASVIAAPAVAAQDPPLPDLSTRAGEDWPTLLGPRGDSVSTGPEPGPWPRSGPRVAYTLEMGEGYAMPSVARGRLFAFDRMGANARLRCVHAETAKPLWEFTYPTAFEDKYGYDGGPRTSPVVDGSRVFIYGPEGMLHALETSTGRVLWKRDTTSEFGVVQNFFGVGSTPVIHGPWILAQVGGSPRGSDAQDFGDLRPAGTGLVAFDRITGAVAWKAVDDLASYSSPVITTLGGRQACLLFARTGLWAVELPGARARLLAPWRAAILESVNAANPVPLDDGQILISETYGPGAALVRVADMSGKIVWSDMEKRSGKSLQAHWCTPVRHGEVVFGSSGRHEGNAELRCVRWKDGKVLWSEPGLGRCSILRVGSTLVVQAERGEVLLVAAGTEKYQEISRHVFTETFGRPLLRYPCWAAPIMARGLIYLRGAGRLICIEAKG